MANLLRIGGPKRLLEKGKLEAPPLDNLAVLGDLPCVVYEANEEFNITRISSNTKELLAIESRNLSVSNWLRNDRVAFPDRELVQTQLGRLGTDPSVWLIHRMIDDSGALKRVVHSVRSRLDGSRRYFHGCLIPIGREGLDQATIDIDIVSKFIHKIGNHFQLLNLMFDSVRRNGAIPKHLDALQQTTETAIGLTRGFANFLQISLAMSAIDLGDLVESSIESKSCLGSEKGVSIEFRRDESNENNYVCGDAALLEMAIAAVIENAIDASPQGCSVKVELCARSEAVSKFGLDMAAVRVVDHGLGISKDQLSQVNQPFYTTKPGHEGMGLCIASRYVELHGGIIHFSSVAGEGAEVEILLPLAESSIRLKGDPGFK